jgi:hypothetical protein
MDIPLNLCPKRGKKIIMNSWGYNMTPPQMSEIINL